MSLTNKKLIIQGHLDPFFETGTEGVIWSLSASGWPCGYANLFPIRDGDRLIVQSDSLSLDNPVWEGDISLEYNRSKETSDFNSKYRQQAVNGMWVHGFQSTTEPQEWADMFWHMKPAILIRDYNPRDKINNDINVVKNGSCKNLLNLLSEDPERAISELKKLSLKTYQELPEKIDWFWEYTSKEGGWDEDNLPWDKNMPLSEKWLRYAVIDLKILQYPYILKTDNHSRKYWIKSSHQMYKEYPNIRTFTDDNPSEKLKGLLKPLNLARKLYF